MLSISGIARDQVWYEQNFFYKNYKKKIYIETNIYKDRYIQGKIYKKKIYIGKNIYKKRYTKKDIYKKKYI